MGRCGAASNGCYVMLLGRASRLCSLAACKSNARMRMYKEDTWRDEKAVGHLGFLPKSAIERRKNIHVQHKQQILHQYIFHLSTESEKISACDFLPHALPIFFFAPVFLASFFVCTLRIDEKMMFELGFSVSTAICRKSNFCAHQIWIYRKSIRWR